MMKRFCLLLLFVFVAASPVWAETLYQQPNNQGNVVKIEKYKRKDAKDFSHPYSFSEAQLQAILHSLKYSKKLILLKESSNRDLFEPEYIDKFTPYLIQAFAKVTPQQAVIWSVVQKRPYFIIRNDKLTVVRMWVVGSELHLDFLKTEAKLQGDYQAKTTGQRIIDDSRSIGVQIEPQQGQKFALDSTDELIVDLNADWIQIAANLEAEDERLREAASEKKQAKKEAKKEAKPSTPASTVDTSVPVARSVSPQDQRDAQTRLTELKKLKDKGLISDKDYEKKKEEILKDL